MAKPQTDTSIERSLPQNLEAERSVLGAILLDNHALNSAIQKLKPEEFFSDQHRRIFSNMIRLHEAQEPIELVTLCEQLRRKDELDAAGGVAYLSQLADGMPRVSHVEHYVRIVKEKAMLRALIYATEATKQAAFEGDDSAAEITERFKSATDGIVSNGNGHKVVLYTPAELTAMISDAVEFIAFPFAARGMVALVDGAPKAAGKTTLILAAGRACCRLDLFLNHATKHVPTLYVTEENPRTFKAALQRADFCDGTDFHILPAMLTGLPWPQLAAQIEQMCTRLKIGWLIVDTFYAIAGLAGDDENKAGAATQALAPLRRLAGKLDVAVTLGRHTRKMGGNIGESGRGSSALTGDADIICELKRLQGARQIQRRQLEFTGRIDPGCFEIELSDGQYRIVEESVEVTDETAVLVAAIDVTPTASVRQLWQSTGVGRNRIPKLLAKAGWAYVDGNGWGKKAVAQ